MYIVGGAIEGVHHPEGFTRLQQLLPLRRRGFLPQKVMRREATQQHLTNSRLRGMIGIGHEIEAPLFGDPAPVAPVTKLLTPRPGCLFRPFQPCCIMFHNYLKLLSSSGKCC